MQCPKCNSPMKEIKIEILHGSVVVDKCENCQGLWFDQGEAEALKGRWMADFLDSGDPEVGKSYDAVRNISCPRCSKPMKHMTDPNQPHLRFEVCDKEICDKHCMFMDAGEFTDFKHETPLDIFRGLIALVKKS